MSITNDALRNKEYFYKMKKDNADLRDKFYTKLAEINEKLGLNDHYDQMLDQMNNEQYAQVDETNFQSFLEGINDHEDSFKENIKTLGLDIVADEVKDLNNLQSDYVYSAILVYKCLNDLRDKHLSDAYFNQMLNLSKQGLFLFYLVVPEFSILAADFQIEAVCQYYTNDSYKELLNLVENLFSLSVDDYDEEPIIDLVFEFIEHISNANYEYLTKDIISLINDQLDELAQELSMLENYEKEINAGIIDANLDFSNSLLNCVNLKYILSLYDCAIAFVDSYNFPYDEQSCIKLLLLFINLEYAILDTTNRNSVVENIISQEKNLSN